MGRSPNAFEHRACVRFYQADPAGVMFHGRVFELVNDAYEELIRSADISFERYFSTQSYLVPIVHTEADYRLPIRAGDTVTVRLLIERIGRASFTYAFSVIGPDGLERVNGRVVHSFANPDTFSTMRMPAEVRACLETLAARHGPRIGPRPSADGR